METKLSFCRLCVGQCGVVLDIADNRILSVRGDREHPLSMGYACVKGLQGGYAMAAPDRILRPLKRLPDGSFAEIGLDQALDEIAAGLDAIRDEDGARAISLFKGTAAYFSGALIEMIRGWMAALGSPCLFTTATIDQSAKMVSIARLGTWAAGRQPMADADVALVFGGNPLVTLGVMGFPNSNVTKRLRAERARGMKLIVVDPRVTETARIADLHVQIRPGQDAALVACLIREILQRNWEDKDFCATYVAGLDTLRAAVEPFAPDGVAARCGIAAATIGQMARMFAHDARRGFATTGTGPSMSGHSNLAEHLVECLNIVCGRYNRAGDVIRNAGVIRPRPLVAEVVPPSRGWESGPRGRVRGFGTIFGEMMTATFPEEILAPGRGRIRAMIVTGGNPASAMPDQRKTVEALRALDLLVAVEPYMTTTARLAHYILPPKLCYERPDLILGQDFDSFSPEPYQQYTEAVLDPPPGSELIEDWRVFYELARRMSLPLAFCGRPVDMDTAPTTDALFAQICEGGPLDIAELKRHPRGMYVDHVATVQPGRQGAEFRFDLAPADVLEEIAAVAAEAPPAGYDFLLVSRRTRETVNSLGINFPETRKRSPYNAAYLNAADLAALGVAAGDRITISSDHGAITTVAAVDDGLKAGVVSIAHCWGGLPDEGQAFDQVGVNTGLLIPIDRHCQTINAMPRMSAVPVNIAPVAAPAEAAAGQVPAAG